MTRVRIGYALRWDGPWHVGSGEGSVAQADRLVLRDARGLPYLPGSSLKGAVRASGLKLADALSLRACTASACRDEPCLVCRLFGSARRPGPVRFGDALIEDALAAGESSQGTFDPFWFDVRFGVQICRQRRIAQERHLYTTEYARGESGRLTGSILGHTHGANDFDRPLPPALWALLCCLEITDRLGGQRSRGAGRVTLSVEDLHVEGLPDALSLWRESLADAGQYQDYVAAIQVEAF